VGRRTLELAERLDLGAERAIALELRGAARNQPGELAGLDDLREALRSTIELGLAPLTGRIANNLTEEQWPVEGPAAALETVAIGVDVTERRGLTWMATWLRVTDRDPVGGGGRRRHRRAGRLVLRPRAARPGPCGRHDG
jgi:hypothetical protein